MTDSIKDELWFELPVRPDCACRRYYIYPGRLQTLEEVFHVPPCEMAAEWLLGEKPFQGDL
jgi:hypothetical protein